MRDHQLQSGDRWLRVWIIQQVAIPVIAFGWAFETSSIASRLIKPVSSVWEIVGVWMFGLWAGLLAHAKFPASFRTSRWIWIPPALVLAAAFVKDARVFSMQQAMDEVLGTEKSGGETGIFQFFLVFPAISCVLYGIGQMLAHRVFCRKSK